MNKYEIGERVFHVTRESPEGVITNWRYYKLDNMIEYQISWSENNWNWYREIEISKTKMFI